jgi:predicted ATP-dependent serine protease
VPEELFKGIIVETQLIRRFLEFHNKVLYRNTFEIFLEELQRAIEEKKITKKSPVAKEIMEIQNAVISAYNGMKSAKHFVLKTGTIKRLNKALEKHENAYFEEEDKPSLQIKKKARPLEGIETPEPTSDGKIMSSVDFAKEEFSTIGFKDKWLDFIGDPAPGFTAMVFGRPKMGKSYLCVDFAGYLARNHGKVLYVSKEEKLDATLQKKLIDKDVANSNLFVSDFLPEDLSGYDFIILDSVNKLGLSAKDLEKLKADNKGKSFVFIFQTTKEGKFRGTNEFQHDVDVVIEVPEPGKAVQFGRFNQGGEVEIFT